MDWKEEIDERLVQLNVEPSRKDEIIAELAQHLDDRYLELRSKGASDQEAREIVYSELTEIPQLARELLRVEGKCGREPVVFGAERRENIAASLLQDLRYVIRSLSKRPAFAIATVAVMTLAIGANTAVFSIVESALINPLPYKDASRLLVLFETEPELAHAPVMPADFLEWKNQSHVFESMSAGTEDTANLTGSGDPERLQVVPVSAGFLATLGTAPALGREFLEKETTTEARVAILSNALWASRFGSSRDVIGKSITLNGASFQVVGVLPAGLKFPAIWNLSPDLLTPLDLSDRTVSLRSHSLFVLGRLGTGATEAQAQTEIETISSRLAAEYPKTNSKIGASVITLKELLIGGTQQPLLILFLAVGFVLLMACANVANVLLTRALAREREMAIRAALGASRSRLIRQLLTESLLLALAGGCAGLLFAAWTTPALLALSPEDYLPQFANSRLSLGVLLFALGASVLSGLFFGLLPALKATHTNLNEGLKEGLATVAGGPRSRRIRNLLVVTEVALALVLLTGAGLMIRSFQRLMAVNPGFDPKNVLTMQADLPDAAYPTPEKATAFLDDVLTRINALPGVLSAGATSQLPLRGGPNGQIQIEGRPTGAAFNDPLVQPTSASLDYFETMSIPLRGGRYFNKSDNAASKNVAIINETLARTFWPGENPIGKRLAWRSNRPTWCEVVGIVSDTHEWGIARKSMPEVFFPFAQAPNSSMTLVIHSRLDGASLGKAVRAKIAEVDGKLPVYGIREMSAILSGSMAVTRFQAMLMGILGVLAVMLASAGIYSVVSYGITQRTHEIGVRKSLGATDAGLLRLIVGNGMSLVLAGLAIGLAGSLALSRLMAGLLFGVSPRDPVTFVVLTAGLAFVGLLACLLPAIRALRIEPVTALRYE